MGKRNQTNNDRGNILTFLQKIFGVDRHALAPKSVQGYEVVNAFAKSYSFESSSNWARQYELYKANPIAQGCTLAYALTIPEAPLVIVKGDSVTTTHALLDKYNSINVSYRMHMAGMLTNICISGNSYDLKIKQGNNIVRLQTLSDKQITPVPNNDGTISHYLLRTGMGVGIEVPVEDVVHTRGFWVDPEQPWRGMSPVELATSSIETYNEATRMAMSLFKNDGVPHTLIVYPNDLDDDQKALIAESFRAKHGGKHKGGVGVLDGGAQLLRLGMSMNDTEAPELMSALESRICSIYRVDQFMAMTAAGLANSTYSNVLTSTKNFTTLTRVPMWLMLQDQISAQWQNEYPEVRVGFDLSEVDALIADPKEAQDSARLNFQTGIYTLDEAREAMGKEVADVPEVMPVGDVAALPVVADPTAAPVVADVASQALNGAQITSLVDIAVQVKAGTLSQEAGRGIAVVAFPSIEADQLDQIFGSSAALTTEPEDIVELNYEADGTIWLNTELSSCDEVTYHSAMTDLIDKNASNLASDLRKVMAQLGKELETLKPSKLSSVVLHKKDPFNVEEWKKKFDAATSATRTKMIDDYMRSAVKSVDENWGDIESILDTVQRNAVASSAEKIKESVDTIKTEITELLAANAGATEVELRELVGARFKNVYAQSRINNIAKTTATATNGATQRDTWKRMGERKNGRKVVRSWLAMAGARPTHAAASGQKEDANGLFNIGGEKTAYPSGSGLSAKNACNCNCITRAHLQPKTTA